MMIKRLHIIILLMALSMAARAQLSGVVTDAATGDTLLYPSASYKGHHIAVSGNAQGRYSIERHEGWVLTFSAVGYQSRNITITEKTPQTLNIKLKPDTKTLAEVGSGRSEAATAGKTIRPWS